MAESILENEEYTKVAYEHRDFGGVSLRETRFDACSFTGCNFSQADLSYVVFNNCLFRTCNLSLAALERTRLRKVVFEECKLTGNDFSRVEAAGIAMAFKQCRIEQANFFGLKLTTSVFKDCSLIGTEFGSCDLSGLTFEHDVFRETNFNQCNLEKSDFRTSQGYTIDPLGNKLRGARFSLPEAASFLGYLGIRLDDDE